MNELPIDYTFSEDENNTLVNALAGIHNSPYIDYAGFQDSIMRLIRTDNRISNDFRNFCAGRKYSNLYEEPYVFLRNCPVDPDLQELDLDSPVVDKRTGRTPMSRKDSCCCMRI